jgi:hypothetical protein
MFRLKFSLVVAITLCAAHPLMAGTFAVGSCKPKSPSFATISAAVSSVPPGSTILVCPGIYPEQVTITQPLNLSGVTDSNQNLALITVPSTGLVANAVSVFGESIAAQLLVQGAGPVSITDIAVDGTGGDLGCAGSTWVAGIFYSPGSSGLVNHAKVNNQTDAGCGVGLWAENTDGADKFVTFQNNSVHGQDGFGIFGSSNASTPNLFLSTRGNVVSPALGLIGIGLDNVTGSVSGNNVANALFGIVNTSSAGSLTFNTVSVASAGIALQGGGTVNNNTIYDSSIGLWFFSDGGVVHQNRISNATVSAVEFNCSAAIVSSNTINDAAIGLNNAPVGFTGNNSFTNTETIKGGGCAAALARASLATANTPAPAAKMGTSIWEWRTPASTNGTLK